MTGTAVARPAHLRALGQASLVTFLWSTSWVLIKIGLEDLALGPLSFAGLRYALAAAILLPLGLRALRATERPPGRGAIAGVALYGLLFISLAQGAQFAALAVLPATAVNLLLASIPVWVAVAAIGVGVERPSAGQLAGVALLVAGAVMYFGPFTMPEGASLGLVAAAVCVAASAMSAHLGRVLARDASGGLGGAAGITSLSMAVGAPVLLAVGLALEGLPALDLRGWLIIGWLAAVNTAFAFTLWNHTLRELTAVESSVVNNTMTIQIAILAVVFLGERLGAGQVLGLGAAAIGALVVQLAPRLGRRPAETPVEEGLAESLR